MAEQHFLAQPIWPLLERPGLSTFPHGQWWIGLILRRSCRGCGGYFAFFQVQGGQQSGLTWFRTLVGDQNYNMGVGIGEM